MKALDFEGTSVVVVGGQLGSGPTIVRNFVQRGARVVVGKMKSQRSAEDAPGVQCLPIDTTDADSVRTFFDACESAAGPVSVMIIMADAVKTEDALSVTPARYREVLEQELIGPMLCMQEMARRMQPRGHGRIIAFASMSGKTGVHKRVTPMAAAKGGLIAFSRALAAEVAPFGVTVNAIATALFDSQVAGASPEKIAEVAQGIPVGRLGRSEEAAHAVLYLASPLGAYVTGETLNLSGGRFMD